MRNNPLITACRDGIFPAIVKEQNTLWNRAITVPQYEGDLLKGLHTARDYKRSIIVGSITTAIFRNGAFLCQYFSLTIHDSYGSGPLQLVFQDHAPWKEFVLLFDVKNFQKFFY
jgi:hypothetical protein